jgi:WD40 repeat protein
VKIGVELSLESRGKMIWSDLPRKETTVPEDPEEIELAYLLQNMHGIEPALVNRLINYYGNTVYQWVEILLYYRVQNFHAHQLKFIPAREQVLPVLGDVFRYAVRHVDEFHGNQSIKDWLFAISLQVVKGWRPKRTIKDYPGQGEASSDRDISALPLIPAEWVVMDRFKKDQRIAMILRYQFCLSLADISQVYSHPVKDIHNWLSSGRSKYLRKSSSAHLKHDLQAYMDGLLDDDPGKLEKVNRHLSECTDCQLAYKNLAAVEEAITAQLKARWNPPAFTSEEIGALVHTSVSETEQHPASWKEIFSFRQAAWLVGLAVMLAGITFVSIRLIPVDDHLSQPVTTTLPRLPPVIDLTPNTVTSAVQQSPEAPLYVAPAFSTDGKWAVFTASRYSEALHSILDRTVYLYNQSTGGMQVINYTSKVNNNWVWWDLAPSISGDGRWVVYVSSTNDSFITGDPCNTADQKLCLDIIVYDRVSGVAKRLTQAYNGGPADGDSLAPTISEDGNWIAFWSTADNLINDSSVTCSGTNFRTACLNIYLYNLATGKMELIPVQSVPGDSVYGVDRISLSSDGRYIGFTVASSDKAGITLNGSSSVLIGQGDQYPDKAATYPIVSQGSEAVVYDRLTGKYELENQAQDGTVGNSESSSPILSGDGRYVAFISLSTNLIPGVNVKKSEIYVRDRLTGKIELISMSSDGQQANNDSGLSFYERGYYSLDISKDGRYVVFESLAANLAPSGIAECGLNVGNGCIYLYVRDRVSAKTETISAIPIQDFTIFPGISSDGRWIGFMESSHDCSATQLRCSNVMLYDRQTGWISNLTRFSQPTARLAWQYSGNLSMPWQSWESTALAFSPDGKLIALGGDDSTVRVWQTTQASDGNLKVPPMQTLEVSGNNTFSALAFNHNGYWLAAGTSGGLVSVWNVADGKLLDQVKDLTGPIKNLAFSQDNSYLVVTTSRDAWMWNMNSSQLIEVNGYSYGSADAYSFAISPLGDSIASAHEDGTIWLQTLPGGQLIERLGTGGSNVNSLVFSSDGSQFAFWLSDGTVFVWQVRQDGSHSSSLTLINHFQTYESSGQLVFSPDHHYLAAAGIVGEVPVWSITDGILHRISTSLPDEMVSSLSFSNDGSRLAVAFESEIGLWAIPDQKTSEFFVHASSDHFIDSTPFSNGTVNDIPLEPSTLSNAQGIYSNLNQTADGLDFPLLVPARLPSGYTFLYGTINQDGSVWLRYVISDDQGNQASLLVYERPLKGERPPGMVVGSDAEVIPTQIQTMSGVVPAEYVEGEWLLRHSFTQPSDGSSNGVSHSVWFWDWDSKSAHLRWEQAGVLIGLYYRPYYPFSPAINNSRRDAGISAGSMLLGEDDLEQIAGGMIYFQSASTKTSYIPILRDVIGHLQDQALRLSTSEAIRVYNK